MTGPATGRTGGPAHGAGEGGRPVVREFAGIGDVPPGVWDALAAGASVWSSRPWLADSEVLRGPGQGQSSYVLVDDDAGPAAALPVHVSDGAVPRCYDPARLAPCPATAARRGPLVRGGPRTGPATDLLLRPDLRAGPGAPGAVTVLRTVLDAVRRRAADVGGSAVMLYLTDAAATALLPCLGPRDRLFVVDARACVDVRHPGPTGARAWQERARFAASGLTVEALRPAECRAELDALGAPPGTPVDDELGLVLLARREGRAAGFAQFLVWEGRLHRRAEGVDRSVPARAAVAANLGHHLAVDLAAANGWTRVDLGCGPQPETVLRGARLEPLWALLLDLPARADDLSAIAHVHSTLLAEFSAWDPGFRTELTGSTPVHAPGSVPAAIRARA